jgi:acyl carrier protein
MPEDQATRMQLKKIIIEALNLEGMSPEMIEDDAPLFGEGLGLDSVDALELVVALERAYGVRIEGPESTREAFLSVATLAAFVDKLRTEGAAPQQ